MFTAWGGVSGLRMAERGASLKFRAGRTGFWWPFFAIPGRRP